MTAARGLSRSRPRGDGRGNKKGPMVSCRVRTDPSHRTLPRLLPTILQIAPVPALILIFAVSAAAQLSDEEARTLESYTLTMDHVVKALKASTALNEAMKRDATLARELDELSREPRLAVELKKLEGHARIKEQLRPLALEPKDFVLTLKTLANARLASTMPPKLPHPGTSAEHIKFFREHEDEIERLEDEIISPSPSARPQRSPAPGPPHGRDM